MIKILIFKMCRLKKRVIILFFIKKRPKKQNFLIILILNKNIFNGKYTVLSVMKVMILKIAIIILLLLITIIIGLCLMIEKYLVYLKLI